MLDGYARSGDVKLEYRGIAFLDQTSSSRYSSRALNASACVMGEGEDVRKEFHRELFLQQPREGEDGVTGTPTIFVNGEKLPGFSPAVIQAAVERALVK